MEPRIPFFAHVSLTLASKAVDSNTLCDHRNVRAFAYPWLWCFNFWWCRSGESRDSRSRV